MVHEQGATLRDRAQQGEKRRQSMLMVMPPKTDAETTFTPIMILASIIRD